jgi:uncharacterized protein YbaP (TraB family)
MRIFARLMAVLALPLLLLGTAPWMARAQQPNYIQEYQPAPAIWQLSDEDTTIYLFGTTHALPQGFRWRTAQLNAIMDRADELVMETVDSAPGDPAADGLFSSMIGPGKHRRVVERIAPDKRAAFRRMLAKSETPESFYDMMPTWMVAFALGVGDMEQQGQTSENGVETVLEARFRKARKPIYAVENDTDVMRNINALPEAAQVRMLEDMLDDSDTAREDVAEGDHAWARGDVARLDKDFTEEELGPEIYDVVVRQRNRAWINWLTARLDRPGVVLFAVGAGHFAGPDSVQTMLARRGFRTSRIQ